MDSMTELEATVRKLKGMGEMMRRLSESTDIDMEEACMFSNFCDDLRGAADTLRDIHDDLFSRLQGTAPGK